MTTPPIPKELLEAIQASRQGRMILMVDHPDRENEGDLVMPGQFVTPEAITFMARFACGLICLAMTPDHIKALGLDMMVKENKSSHKTAFTVSIEAASGVTTGISAFDRAHTIKVASAQPPVADALVSPGHIFPLSADPKGVLGREGHTEGSTDLMKLAGLRTSAVICEVMGEDGRMLRGAALKEYAKKHALPIISVAAIKSWIEKYGDEALEVVDAHYSIQPAEKACEGEAELLASADFPDEWGGEDMKIHVFRVGGQEHIALTRGDLSEGTALVRVHSGCITGDALGSLRCDCGPQLRESLRRIHESERGAVIYIPGHEGRGIGLINKIKAYALQDKGMDTKSANEALGFPAESRDFTGTCKVLKHLGAHSIRLMTNNPIKANSLAEAGFDIVSHERIVTGVNPHNVFYLDTKRRRMGHELDLPTSAGIIHSAGD